MPLHRRRAWRTASVVVAYLLLSLAATWPLARDLGTTILSDPGDPLLNTSILVWNATTRPFSAAWWNAPHFYPSTGVVAYTESLLGLSPLATPLYWLTHNAFLAYNSTVFVCWPLSAIAAFLLVRRLTKRDDAAFLAGVAFGFTPYRAVALGHLQTMATFGVPFMLLGLHGYLEERRRRWLVLFGAAWIFQSFANGYYIVYGGLFFGLWLLYFCGRRAHWRKGAAIVGTLALASLPVLPMLIGYRQVHDDTGLHRTFYEILYYSASPASWFEVGSSVWLWHSWLPTGMHNLFPGASVVLLAVSGILFLLLRPRIETAIRLPFARRVRAVLWVLLLMSLTAILVGLRYGQVDTTIASIAVRQRSLDRALSLFLLAGIPLALTTPRIREALGRRSPLMFYGLGTVLFAVLCCGPRLTVHGEVILDPAPYGWLMALPGFNELRVPTQLKMIHLLCLTVSAGLAFAALPLRRVAATAVFVAASIGLVADGWIAAVPLAPVPEIWATVEPADRPEPILELPLGLDFDTAATYRASIHHRRVLNGVSGYDPPHYAALRDGLAARDPAMLTAIASLGRFDIVVDGARDPDGAIGRYAAAAPGAVKVASDGVRTTYRVPAGPPLGTVGEPVAIADAWAVQHQPDWPSMHDGRIETRWAINPQAPDNWVMADVGRVQPIGGVSNLLGEHPLDYPQRLRVDVSSDARQWHTVWEGPTAAETFLGFVREPRIGAVTLAFPPHAARYVRLQQLERAPRQWWIAELRVHRPTGTP